MGHWEQIAVENQKERQRIAALPPWRRWLVKMLMGSLIILSWMLLLGGTGYFAMRLIGSWISRQAKRTAPVPLRHFSAPQPARATGLRASAGKRCANVVPPRVLGTFAVVMSYAIIRGMPTGSEGVLMSGLIETLKLMSVSVVSYWVGSSAGSASKDAALKQLAAGR